MNIGPEDFELGAIGAAGTFWVTGTGLSAEPCRAATLAALEHRAGGPGRAATILDLDYRPMFWRDRGGGAAAAKAARQALPWTTVAVGNLDEVEVAVGSREPREAARRLRALGPELAVVKMGPAGVFASDGEQEVEIGALEVPVLNGLGAGDAFGGALAVGLGRGLGLHRALELANAAGALVASRHACADAMPDEAELEAALA